MVDGVVEAGTDDGMKLVGISVGVSITADGVGLEDDDSVIVDGVKDGVVEAYDGMELAVGDSDGAEVDGMEVVGSNP